MENPEESGTCSTIEVPSKESPSSVSDVLQDTCTLGEEKKWIPEVFVATWMPEDHIFELTRILKGVEADRVERCLVQYVEESIEPAGWRAIWQASPHSLEKWNIHQSSDFLVDVINVSREKLVADVKICEAIQKGLVENDASIEQVKDKVVTVPLMQLYPLATQENDAVDITTTAEVVEQIRFFYKNVWQAWDLEEDNCCYDRYLITARLKIYQDIEAGRIPSAIGSELRSLVTKASEVQREIDRIEKSDDDGEVDQREVLSLIQFHKQLEKLKARYDLLQEPVLRELSCHYQPVDRCWSVSSSRSRIAKVKIVIDCLSGGGLSFLTKLPELLGKLPQVQENAACQGFPTLQLALDTAIRGDIIVVLPGIHVLQHVGLISDGGTLVGLGDNVVIEGTKEAGDVLMDISGDFTLENVMLKPASGQVGIVHHKGILSLSKVVLEGGLGGVIGLGKTHSKIEDATIRGCDGKGVDFREGANAILSNSSFVECAVGIHLEEDSKVSVSNCNIKNNSSFGILIMWPEGSDISCFKNIPKEELMRSLLKDYEGNCVDHNKEDAVVITATKPSSVEELLSSAVMKNSNPHGSSGSLDSGLEVVEHVKANEGT